jgi:prepilin-type N-terminal cleavage/methylation domain-containing protein
VKPHAKGFTLIEMVMVIVLVGIMSVVALPRMLDKSFSERGMRDGAKAALQHARHVAIASRRYTCVNITQGSGTAGTIAIRMDTTLPETTGFTTVSCAGAAGTAVTLASSGSNCATNQVCAPSGVSLSVSPSTQIIFDPQGRSVDTSKNVNSNSTLTVSNQPVITVNAETGFVQ